MKDYPHTMQRRNIKLSDGRNLEYLHNNIESEATIILHAGTMQDISGWQIWLDYFANQGASALSFGRSGYVTSTKKPGRVTIDVARDITELADALGIKRMVNVGLSGGGQHAIACGIDARTSGIVTIGSLAPYSELESDFYNGMQQADIDEYQDALRDIKDLINRFQGYKNADSGATELPMELSPNDRKAQASPSWKVLMDSLAYTNKHGFDWVADDYTSYLQPWGFDPRDIKNPVIIWQGGQDKNVPPQHGKWLANHLPNSKLHLLDDETHIGVFINYEEEIMNAAIKLLY